MWWRADCWEGRRKKRDGSWKGQKRNVRFLRESNTRPRDNCARLQSLALNHWAKEPVLLKCRWWYSSYIPLPFYSCKYKFRGQTRGTRIHKQQTSLFWNIHTTRSTWCTLGQGKMWFPTAAWYFLAWNWQSCILAVLTIDFFGHANQSPVTFTLEWCVSWALIRSRLIL